MSMQKVQTTSFEVTASVQWIEGESRPELNFHFFGYRIRITNKGTQMAQLVSRHWIITDSTGHVEEIRGAGVVGQQPKIQPGQSFEYESACPLNASSGSMKGSYQMVGANGESFEIEIPEFFLIAPTALH